MKNVLIFSSEVGSTKFIYNSIIQQNIFRFTFILSNNQNPSIYNDPRFINFKDFDLSLVKDFDLGIISFTVSKEDLIFGDLFIKNNIKFGRYIDSWMQIERKCKHYKQQVRMIGSFLLIPNLELLKFIQLPLSQNFKIFEVGHSELESVEKNKLSNYSRSGVAIYSQPISRYYGDSILNEYDLINQTIISLKKNKLKLSPISIILHPSENENKFNKFIINNPNVYVSYNNKFNKSKVLPELITLLFTTHLFNTYIQKTPTISLYNGNEESNKEFLKNYSIFSKSLEIFDNNIKNYSEIFKNQKLKKISFIGSKKKFENIVIKLLN